MHIKDLQPNPVLGDPRKEVVSAWTAVDTQSVLTKARKKLNRMHAMAELRSQGWSAAATRAAADTAAGGKGWRDLLTEYRARLLRVVKATYGELSIQHALTHAWSPKPHVSALSARSGWSGYLFRLHAGHLTACMLCPAQVTCTNTSNWVPRKLESCRKPLMQHLMTSTAADI